MSKKTLRNVWLVQDKCPDSVPLYFAGFATSEHTKNDIARFEPLSADTKTYKNEKGAKIGASMAAKHYESPFIEPVYIEFAEFDVAESAAAAPPKKTAQDTAPAPKEPLLAVPESEHGGWVALDKLCGKYPLMLRKKVGDVIRFAIAFSAADIRYLPADEIFAWTRYYDECKDFVVERIRERRIAAGKAPDGADEWKKGGT